MLTLDAAKIVLLGNFNPYIISPEWLAAQKIWEAESFHRALGAVRGEGVQFRGNKTEWQVTTDRLMIASTEANISELAISVLDALPHTPMTAVLSSFSFEAPTDAVKTVFSSIRALVPKNAGAELYRWSTVLHIEGARVDITFVNGDQGTTVTANLRRAAQNADDARLAAAKFSSDRVKVEELIKSMMNEGKP